MTATAYGHDIRHAPATIARTLAGAKRSCFWLDDPERPPVRPALSGATDTDLLVIGGGYCGLWTAIRAKERDPHRSVVLIDGQRVGWAASGRNGGFVEADLTHGPENGARHFAAELDVLDRLGRENFDEIAATIARYDIDAEYEAAPMLTVATEAHQVAVMRASGDDVLTGDNLRRLGNSPVYRAGVLATTGHAYVHPAKLAWGLAKAAEALGVRIYEHTAATSIARHDRVEVRTTDGVVRADRVALATNGFPSLLKRLRLFTVPIYDYVLMTEPLSGSDLASIGWTGRHGITDSGREFHYYRKSADNRILFGGWDAVYHRGRRVRSAHDQRDETFERLADHFLATFPQLDDVRFTHRWGGMIDMSTQLVAFHGATSDHRIAYSAGFTGLGVGATRFGADTMLDLLEERDTERTRLSMAMRKPIPVPPEPIAYPLIQTMRAAVARSDANGGRDGFLLKAANLFGVGFDS